MDIILASGSPRRKELLERMGIRNFKVISPDIDEVTDTRLSPAEIVESLSLQKATAVAEGQGEDVLVIAADTIVTLDGAILGKPNDEMDAFKTLSALSGGRHQVYTGLTVLCNGEAVTQHEVTTVTFRELTEEEIDDYISTGEPMDKAGSYGIQGYGALFISEITGDYPNVVGLPVARLGKILEGFGVNPMKLAAGR
ncbi:MAG: Maf family protein [Oscillospiraceae bacterium]